GESEGVAVLVAAEVVALVFLGDVPVPVGAGAAAGGDGAEPEHGLGSGQAPAGAGDAHPVLHEVAAGALDDAGGDGPAVGQGPRVVHEGLFGLQVGQGLAADPGVLPAGLGRVLCGQGLDAGDDVAGAAVQDVQGLGDHPVFYRGVAGRVEAPGGLPQVFQHVDEVDHDGQRDTAGSAGRLAQAALG